MLDATKQPTVASLRQRTQRYYTEYGCSVVHDLSSVTMSEKIIPRDVNHDAITLLLKSASKAFLSLK